MNLHASRFFDFTISVSASVLQFLHELYCKPDLAMSDTSSRVFTSIPESNYLVYSICPLLKASTASGTSYLPEMIYLANLEYLANLDEKERSEGPRSFVITVVLVFGSWKRMERQSEDWIRIRKESLPRLRSKVERYLGTYGRFGYSLAMSDTQIKPTSQLPGPVLDVMVLEIDQIIGLPLAKTIND
ncbi:hypothetical protein BDP27DRAFT_1406821 [Rhodocollybia butyracea]|uniref:Uncharacterized protein n=1 Tax=Rhodocollybia butyracea TaxID=206335 RepID=A0A9P5PDF0_9AGAR|nr:hypothetical protein BDP27DRAFT_1406821 [Rhodocollybia butyracea]